MESRITIRKEGRAVTLGQLSGGEVFCFEGREDQVFIVVNAHPLDVEWEHEKRPACAVVSLVTGGLIKSHLDAQVRRVQADLSYEVC